jgi:hypothetical protein
MLHACSPFDAFEGLTTLQFRVSSGSVSPDESVRPRWRDSLDRSESIHVDEQSSRGLAPVGAANQERRVRYNPDHWPMLTGLSTRMLCIKAQKNKDMV